jgi:hypothetical protein
MLYAAKCYWPSVTQADLDQVAERATRAGLVSGGDGVAYLGSLLFASDDLVLWLFPGPVAGGPHPGGRPARHPQRTAHGLGLRPWPSDPGTATTPLSTSGRRTWPRGPANCD